MIHISITSDSTNDSYWCSKPVFHRITRCDKVCNIAYIICDTLVTLLHTGAHKNLFVAFF